jgi:serine acetyltransferase
VGCLASHLSTAADVAGAVGSVAEGKSNPAPALYPNRSLPAVAVWRQAIHRGFNEIADTCATRVATGRQIAHGSAVVVGDTAA